MWRGVSVERVRRVQSLDANSLTSAGTSLYKAATLSDSDIAALSNDSCKASDAESKIAPANSAYAKRLTKVMKGFGDMTLNGQKINYKVYMTKDVNAWAMGNGCVRVYSGLMDQMNDDELRGVIGHEMGHVALGHSKKAMQTAYAVSAARTAAGAASPGVAALTKPQLGDITEVHQCAVLADAGKRGRRLLVRPDEAEGHEPEGPRHRIPEAGEARRRQEPMMDSHPSSASRAQHRGSHREGQLIAQPVACRGGRSSGDMKNPRSSGRGVLEAGAAYGTIPGSTYACASVINRRSPRTAGCAAP